MERSATPRSRAKRERVRAVAQQLFVQQGFEGTSMDAIAIAVGVSKPTLYRYYQNKESLFADVLRDLTVRRVWSDVPPVLLDLPITNRIELRQNLIALAQSAVHHLLDPTYLGLLRVLIAEIPRFPTLAPLFRSTVLEEGPHLVSSVLARAYATGIIARPPTEAALRLFVGPLLSYVLSHGLLTPQDAATEPALDDLVVHVDLFLTAMTNAEPADDGSVPKGHQPPGGGLDA